MRFRPPQPRFAILHALLVGVALWLVLASTAYATFVFERYDGSWTSMPDFSLLTPVSTGMTPTVGSASGGDYGLVFTNTINVPEAGTYFFSTRSDAGSKLFVDGVLVVDNDGVHPPTTVEGSRVLAVGDHSIRIEYFATASGGTLEVGYRTGIPIFEPIPPDGRLVFMSPNPASIGSWGPVIPWPEIAISAAVLPDGKILTWSSTEIDAFPEFSEFTHASVFDPATETFVPVDSGFHDMFCAGVATLENGTIIAAGGNPSDRRVSSFNPATQTWTPLADMVDLRWYGTTATLPDNTVFASFAKDAGPRTEVYNPATNTWSPRSNADATTQLAEQNAINSAPNPTSAIDLAWISHIAVTPQGDVFQGGPTPTWHRYDPMGGAATVPLGQPIGDVARSYGNAVTYGEGKILLVGGADLRLDPPTSTSFVHRVDLTGPAPTVTPGAPMRYRRALLNTVTLANGELLVIGGNTVARYFDDEGSILHTEIYTPQTNSWRTTDAIDVPRNYHSTALLMKDGRVIAMGGGGRWSGHPANHLDGQIFSPPYLFESDGSPAVRPTLSVPAPAQVRAGDSLVVTASPTTTSFSMVRLAAVTHHLNTDQRFLPVPSVANGDGTFTLQFPANPNTLIVGPWFLFALDADGTPSIGETIQVVRDVESIPDPTAVYVSDLPWTSQTNGLGPAERDRSNGNAAAGDGGPLRLAGASHAKGVGVHAFSEISVALDGKYERFLAQIGLDDAQDGQCGEVQFEVALDGVVAYTSGTFVDTTPTGSIDLAVGTANTMTLRVFTLGSACGDLADWADARLVPKPAPGFRYYRFRPTKLRSDATANGIQLAEFALFKDGTRHPALFETNPGGNNPVGQGPTRADDALASTSWRDFNRGDLVYDMGARVEIDAYSLTTASDAPERDPVRWLLEASIDGIVWEILDDRTGVDYATPTARETATPALPIQLASPITPLPFAPRHSTTLIVEKSSGADRIWNVNPDNDSITVSSAAGTVLAEIPVGDRPWSLARQPGQAHVYVVNKGSASISVIDAVTLTPIRTIALDRASEPHGLVFSADGSTYYVVLEAAARVEKRLAATDALLGSLALSGRPRHVSIGNDDARLLVSNFITPPIPGESTLSVAVASGAAQVFSIDPATMTLDETIALTHDGRAQSESQGPGMPNYLGPAVVEFAGQRAYVPSKKDNVRAGALRGVAGLGFDSAVRAATSRIDLVTGTEDPTLRIDHDNSSVATGAALSGDDRYLFVTLETSRQLAVYDLQDGYQLMRLPTGRAPQSVALSSDGRTAYVHDFMDRRISRFDLTEMLETNLPATNPLPPIQTVAVEALPPTILLGKQLFYDAADDRLALDDYLSCASCHNDGDGDGRVWDLGGFGEGLRNTIDLRGKGAGHGRPHWTGNFDEVQDFEGQIRGLNLGSGLLTPTDFAATSAPLGPPKAGLSADLDALAAYVNSLTTPPASPSRPGVGTLGADATQGRLEFAQLGCLGCHSVPSLTDSPTTVRHDVGTIKPSSGQRLGGPLDGFDTPGLIGAWANPPFLHDGSAPTLEAAITAHTAFASLPPATLGRLAAFLREAEPTDLIALVDTDADGVLDLADPAPANPCIPTTFVAVCGADTDGDGASDFQEGATADADGDGVFDFAESSTADADGDGAVDQSDPANGDACIPSRFVAVCTADTDGDGATDFQEGATADGDGDGLLDYQESSTTDTDGDGVANQGDPANADACVPTTFVSVCTADTDGDGATNFQEGPTADGDGDGLLDYQESSTADADGDGAPDQVDAANGDPCIPTTFVAVCSTDADGDGATNFQEGATADADGDGLFDYQESSTADVDGDGVANQSDPANGDACIPSRFVAVCTADTDGDGATDFQEGATADGDGDGVLDYQESSTADADGDGVADQADPANGNACVPTAFAPGCSTDTDGDGATDFQEGPTADGDGDGLLDYQESSTTDTDGDGVANQGDPANADACVPTTFVPVCNADADGDGATNFQEGPTADGDGDGLLDYQESSTADADGDGVFDQSDPANANACVPTTFVAACTADADGDGATDFQEGATTDSDGDGLFDYQESSIADADEDGVADQSDPANGDACIPDPQACAPPNVPMAGPAARIVLLGLLLATGLGLAGRRRSA